MNEVGRALFEAPFVRFFSIAVFEIIVVISQPVRRMSLDGAGIISPDRGSQSGRDAPGRPSTRILVSLRVAYEYSTLLTLCISTVHDGLDLEACAMRQWHV